jgi:branched-chain amino acid transport system substrate-binding protein
MLGLTPQRSVLLDAAGLVAAAALALGLWGCGKREAAAPAAPKESEAAKEILIGAVAPKTGEAATFGISCENGVRLAIEQANASGGLLGRKLQLIVEDDKGDPVAGKIAFSRLIEKMRVCAVIGAVMSKVSLAGADVAEASHTPMISSSSTSQFVTLGKRYVFRACFTDPFQGLADAHIAFDTLKARHAAVLYDSSNDYNKGLAEVFKKVFTDLGGEVVAYESYPERSNDFKPQLTKILPAAPDVLFLPNYYNDVALQMSQAREIGIKATFVGGDGWDSPELLKVPAAEGGYFSDHFSRESDSPCVKAFVAAYRQRFGVEPDALASLGYEATEILLDAIRRAGSDDRDKIRDALETTDLDTITTRITFDKDHNPIKPAAILEIENGRQVFKDWVKP